MRFIGEYLKETSVWATLLIISCISSSWLYSVVYLQLYPLIPLVLCLGGILFFFELIMIRTIGAQNTKMIFTFAIVTMCLYLLFSFLRIQIIPSISINFFWKIIVVVITFVISILIAFKLVKFKLSRRFNQAVAVAGIIYLAAPLAYSHVSSRDLNLDFSTIKRPTVILVLDELSDTASGPIVAALNQIGFHIRQTSLSVDGVSTLDVIPRFFMRKNFSDATPCSSNAICAGENVLDFSKITITSDVGVNIIGFHHPYCAIKGLAYCYQGISPIGNNAVIGFGCYWMGRLGFAMRHCGEALLSPDVVNKERYAMLEAIRNATFWRNGGLLYIHILLPHPPGIFDNSSLDAAYYENIHHASLMVVDLAKQLSITFPKGFQLFVTSDHPLRPDVWCSTYRYAEKCEVRQSFKSKRVPLISISNNVAQSCLITSNSHIFDCLE